MNVKAGQGSLSVLPARRARWLAVLAALNIADDYFRALEETRELKRQVALKSRALLRELDRHGWERVRGADGDEKP